MHVTFLGAVREVTGSMHLITTQSDQILLDCGMFQGRRKESDKKNRKLPFNPRKITNIVLSHAHIDHSGRIPMVTRKDFRGHVICSRATADACEYLLLDSAHIQESDANYLNYKTVKSYLTEMKESKRRRKLKKQNLNDIKQQMKSNQNNLNTERINSLLDKFRLTGIQPLYSMADAEQSLTSFSGFPYRHSTVIGEKATCRFYEAGHILGSAVSMINIQENSRPITICYTGDIGRFNKPILKDPVRKFEEEDRDVDLMIMESTYGNRVHPPVQDLKPKLKAVINEAVERQGVIVIPAFAYGRTQELLYVIHELYREKEVPSIPVYVDSPLATKLTKVFGEHPEVYDRETHEDFLEKGVNPFSFDQLRFTESVEESMALNKEERPHIVIAGSGMCEGGRILHHLRHKIDNPKHTILIVGYMASNTLGRRILETGLEYEASGRSGSPPILKFLNKEYPLNARVVKLDGFSAHGDKNEMLRFLKESNLRIKRIAIVHGEEDQSLSFADFLTHEGYSVFVPKPGEKIKI